MALLLPTQNYREYTLRFNESVNWLAHVAQATGTVNDVFKTIHKNASTTTGRRVQGQASKNENEIPPSPGANKIYDVPIQSLGKLASAVKRSKHTTVPMCLLSSMHEYTSLRHECLQWFLDNQSDRINALFIDNNGRQLVLYGALNSILITLRAKQTAAQESGLASLASEESTNTYKLKASSIEPAFAIYCLLKDVANIRSFVKKTWREFKNGDIGLQAASLATNAAMALVERLSNEFEDDFPNFKEKSHMTMHHSIIAHLAEGYCNIEAGGEIFIALDNLDENQGFTNTKASTALCTTLTTLMYDIFLKRSHAPRQVEAFQAILCKCVSQLAALPPDDKSFSNIYKDDYTYKAAYTMMKEIRLNSWIVFALQILWETQNELGEESLRAPEILRVVGMTLQNDYQHYAEAAWVDKTTIKPKDFVKAMKKLTKIMGDLTVDQGEEFQEFVDAHEKYTQWKLARMAELQLVDCHPSLCGVAMAYIRDTYHKESSDMAADFGHVVAVAHLYNAIQQSLPASEKPEWTDMDWFLSHQDCQWILAGKPVKQKDAYANDFCIALGLNPACYTKDRKFAITGKGLSEIHGKKGTGLRRFRYVSRYAELAVHRREKNFLQVGEPNKAEGDVVAMADAMASSEQNNIQDFRASHYAHPEPSPLATLGTFTHAVDEDEFALSFNVLGLHMTCLEMVKNLQTHCRENAPDDYPAEPYAKPQYKNAVVAEILRDIAGCPRLNETMFPHAVSLISEIIAAKGNECSTGADILLGEMREAQMAPEEDVDDEMSEDEEFITYDDTAEEESVADEMDQDE
ncbi:hypothetical protein EJ02DRAFT_429394 [Clathrospora elynae]|uniref:DUF6604 domain-containing protein n=1 Tax=Clathrospora elynae TaxID=706981 RepID=A0A6A5T5X8_9PLEO|nr:hypothetical protein EJ02DRAFT_429394 [Clathrospora elynae]